ncbi:MAG: ABC transporter permease, partial [Paracoccaceae bacterium]
LAGLILGLTAILLPAWQQAHNQTVTAARRSVGRKGAPLWQRVWLDVILLGLAAGFFWQSAGTGYEIVLAPEGVAAASVDYKAFLAPALFWVGSGLLLIRVIVTAIGANALVRRLLAPIAGRLAPVVAASLATQARRITLGVAMTALAVSFGTSTAIFNATYQAQARVDAMLTNGADVGVFGTTDAPSSLHLAQLAAMPGVTAEPMQHRFAYVGSDLQDLYGISTASIRDVTQLSDAFFSGITAAQAMAKLAAMPDGVLLSEETVSDFQLTLGDSLNMRLMAADHQYRTVPFTFVGVAREFPTAPKDSFLVANAAYVAAMTGNALSEYVLLRTNGDPAALAAAVQAALPDMQVHDIAQVTRIIGSSLTAVNLTSLTRIELGFAVLMAASAAGLMLALGFNDRRRSFAILSAIGAKQRQLGAFLWSEGLLVFTFGSVLGLLSGAVTAWMLVKLLTGVFDPPPEGLVMPVGYLALLIGLVAAAVTVAVQLSEVSLRKRAVEQLREL